jgi:formamidopyrimidine-DNA glycosylase
MRVVPTDDLQSTPELSKLAPEPFSDDFSTSYLRAVLGRSNRPLKLVLLDQTKVLGLGNIYACEAMFLARLNPKRRASGFSGRRIDRLFETIREVLTESMAHGSTMNVDPENIDGSYYDGAYESKWRVYDREGEPCVECSSLVRRVIQGGRSTYFCPSCQR